MLNSEKWSVYGLTDYNFNALTTIGTNTIVTSIGASYKLINQDKFTLNMSAGPWLQWLDGGVNCSIESYCGDIMPDSTLSTDLKWVLNNNLQFTMNNLFTTAYNNGITPSYNFNAGLKFVPSLDSNLFTSIRFQSIIQTLQTLKLNNSINFKVGTEF